MIGRALLATAVLLPPSVHPWPVGPSPRYTPPAQTTAVAAGVPVGSLTCGATGPGYRVHLELFANRKVVIVPSGIGVSKAGCRYPVTTAGPDGIIRVAPGLHLSDVFRVWGQTLSGHRLASFTSARPLRAYVGGKLVRGPAGAIPLTPHNQIVVELGGYVPPHPFFLFAGGDS
jgi:hypothetical protein